MRDPSKKLRGVLDPLLLKNIRYYDFVIMTVQNWLHKLLLNSLRWLLPPNENYFLPSTAIRSGSRIPVTSKKELFAAIV